MTRLQRVIKTLATLLAVFLAAAIVGGIVKTVIGLSFAVDLFTVDSVQEDVSLVSIMTDFDEKSITFLEVDLATANLRIEVGKTLQVSQNSNDVWVKQQGNSIVIEEREHPVWVKSGTVTLTVPKDFVFWSADIDTGAGRIQAETLYVKDLSLSVGAGEAAFETLSVSRVAEIETGAGKLTISDGAIQKLDLELGVGKAEIVSSLGDGSRAECGVGALSLTLLGGADTYTVRAQTGIGRFDVDGQVLAQDTSVGSGVNTVTVEGGIGSVDVTFS